MVLMTVKDIESIFALCALNWKQFQFTAFKILLMFLNKCLLPSIIGSGTRLKEFTCLGICKGSSTWSSAPSFVAGSRQPTQRSADQLTGTSNIGEIIYPTDTLPWRLIYIFLHSFTPLLIQTFTHSTYLVTITNSNQNSISCVQLLYSLNKIQHIVS